MKLDLVPRYSDASGWGCEG